MQVKFINTDSLDSKVINIKGGTLDEILEEASGNIEGFDKTILQRNGSLLRFNGYIGDIIYHGTPRAEQHKGRTPKDWTQEIEVYNTFYEKNPDMTAKEFAEVSKLPLNVVYYMSKKLNKPLKAGQRGRRKSA